MVKFNSRRIRTDSEKAQDFHRQKDLVCDLQYIFKQKVSFENDLFLYVRAMINTIVLIKSHLESMQVNGKIKGT